ncbi:carboxylating nicotinate-nucleotide diphosphorylase [Sulfuracidifex metallicus]|jgi:nicotinate-nucleotide pyrophosphorylase (carboxylating)|uniref:Nicotinate-nucleotide pyrophosphorylase [carboxylating] n=1 Tax=Sulfuracidifex metallicus DSM 6482 = JCM 9184 TaxID=523847 RepID=A0A6A9QN41_SULME|nr:carboxylating nicotinate-nucleotide diphosphorylase [Sulfuracidifex metallicus]MUN29148.1 carboxylating nicotinate-nucleotide diphosphorylase [Sulfuracidifex metallicus DSM 6482 = JCM 9184]WOE50330.1 carboxylating nicotinate-nucleotide diphosphorylase [Sulfuracidifex metallicus DSM 6482 = JCM 9184]
MLDSFLVEKLLSFLKEDAYPDDITGRLASGINSVAQLRLKEEGVLCGVRVVIPFLKYMGLQVRNYREDGSKVKRDDIVLTFEGDGEVVLAVERTVLNVISRLSGVSTATKLMVENAREVNQHVRIAGTRKTTPGFRDLEKYAIEVGGGDPHRLGLFDAVLIKDNHISLLGGVSESIRKAKSISSFTKKIEVEVSSLEDAMKAYREGVDAILLDNMTPQEVREVVQELKGKVILEASGNITPDNVRAYASTGVDVISSGFITHSSKALDMSLDVFRF